MCRKKLNRLSLLERRCSVHPEIRKMSAELSLEIGRLEQPDGRRAEHRTVEFTRAQNLRIHEALIDIHQRALEAQTQRIGSVGIDKDVEHPGRERQDEGRSGEPAQ